MSVAGERIEAMPARFFVLEARYPRARAAFFAARREAEVHPSGKKLRRAKRLDRKWRQVEREIWAFREMVARERAARAGGGVEDAR